MTRQITGQDSRGPTRSLLVRLAQWVVPYRIYCAARDFGKDDDAEASTIAEGIALASKNSSLAGRHRGERCFILCNGPSVRKQDLLPLSEEVVISVSSGYHHPDFARIHPRYHCVPRISSETLSQDEVARWFGEMNEKVGNATLFLSTMEQPLVQSRGLFAGRDLHYVFLHGRMDEYASQAIPDISRVVPGVQSVPIMALMIAMYLGFAEIYLLGTDHDHFKTGEYKYFYEPTVLKGKDYTVGENGRVLISRYQDFHDLAALWRQYRAMKRIAEANGIRIYNATAGGELDEFPRARLEEVLAERGRSRV